MPQDPHLYGQRPAKKQKKDIPLSSSLAFTSQLTSLLASSSTAATATPTAAASSGRARPSKQQKDDLFSVKAKKKRKAQQQGEEDGGDGAEGRGFGEQALKLKTPRGTEDERRDLLRARRNMEEKARLYAAMKRGDYVAPGDSEASGPLVDFDRKWAESHPDGGDPNHHSSSSSGSDNDDDDEEADGTNNPLYEIIEYQDEFGRTRRGTRAEALRHERRARRQQLGAAELEAMAARPSEAAAYADDRLIRGDAIQTAAFDAAQAALHQQQPDAAARMADLAARRDRAPTPPADAHFDGRAEAGRAKGVGFYQFSTDDADARRRQMEGLAAERRATELARAAREEERERRRQAIAERRRQVGAARAGRLADSFLDGLAGELGEGGGGGGGGGSEGGGQDGGNKESGGTSFAAPTITKTEGGAEDAGGAGIAAASVVVPQKAEAEERDAPSLEKTEEDRGKDTASS